MSKCEEEALWNRMPPPPPPACRPLWLLMGVCLGAALVAALAASEVVSLRLEQSRLRADFDDLVRRLQDDPKLEDEIRLFHKQSVESDRQRKTTSTPRTTTEAAPGQYDSEYQEYSEEDDEEQNYDADEDEEDQFEDDEEQDLMEDEEEDNENKRNKRDVELSPPVRVHGAAVVGRTSDGVPVVSHSYQQVKQLNRTGMHLRLYDNLAASAPLPSTEDPIRPHHRVSPLWNPPKKHAVENKKALHANKNKKSGPGATPGPILKRISRVMQTPEGGESVSLGASAPPSVVLRVMQHQVPQPQAHESQPPVFVDRRWPAGPKLRSLDHSQQGPVKKPRRTRGNHHPLRVAAHFTANSTMYTLAHANYKGNGRLRHAGVFTDWSASNFMEELALNGYFNLKDGILTVKQGGLYYFYSQIYYIEEHDNNGYNVYVNNAVRLQCVTTTHSNSNIVKVNTCFTGGILFLQPGDTIFLRDIAGLRYSLFEPEKSFFGLFRFANGQPRSSFN